MGANVHAMLDVDEADYQLCKLEICYTFQVIGASEVTNTHLKSD